MTSEFTCFREQTFCGSDCTRHTCTRHFGEQDSRDLDAWWGAPGGPIVFQDFREECSYYTNEGGEPPHKLALEAFNDSRESGALAPG